MHMRRFLIRRTQGGALGPVRDCTARPIDYAPATMVIPTSMSTPLRAIAWIYAILGAAGLAGGFALLVGIGLSGSPGAADAIGWVSFFFVLAAIPYLLPALLGGWAVLTGRRWGRVPCGIVSVLLLPAFPFGTLLGGFGLWALVRSPAPPSPARRAPVRAAAGAPGFRPGPLFDLLAAMALVGSGFAVAIWAGFLLHDDPMPAAIEQAHVPALAILLIALGWTVHRLAGRARGSPARGALRRRAQRDYADWKVERARHIASLRADPALCGYADRIEAGENWSDAQIAYDLDPDAVGTCAHLAPFEHALRRAGIGVKLQLAGTVHARCLIDEPALRARFAVEPPTWYGIIPDYQRSYEDPPSAAFRCAEHGAMLYVIAPGQAAAGTPVFPA
jgi:hypothetical protein